MKCQKCQDKKYTNSVDHIDGSTLFTVCPCTGITAESLRALAKDIQANGPAVVQTEGAVSND